jgi:hypothetical protein
MGFALLIYKMLNRIRLYITTLTTATLFITGATAMAQADVATSQGAAANHSSGVLGAAAAQSLYGDGRIPLISDHDAYYDPASPNKGAGFNDNQCRTAWQNMRNYTSSNKKAYPNFPSYWMQGQLKRVKQGKKYRSVVEEGTPADFEVKPISAAVLKTVSDKAASKGLPIDKFKRALGVYLANQKDLPEQRYISVVDFDKNAGQERWFFVDLQTGEISKYRVSAGDGTEPIHNGNATAFSNSSAPGTGTLTHASSLGCAVASGHYRGAHGDSIKIHGFEKTNDNSCSRLIAVHQTPSKYRAGYGRSNGCLATDQRAEIAEKLGAGGLICSYHDQPYSEAPLKAFSSKKGKRHGKRRRLIPN